MALHMLGIADTCACESIQAPPECLRDGELCATMGARRATPSHLLVLLMYKGCDSATGATPLGCGSRKLPPNTDKGQARAREPNPWRLLDNRMWQGKASTSPHRVGARMYARACRHWRRNGHERQQRLKRVGVLGFTRGSAALAPDTSQVVRGTWAKRALCMGNASMHHTRTRCSSTPARTRTSWKRVQPHALRHCVHVHDFHQDDVNPPPP